MSGGHPRTLDTLLRAVLDCRKSNIATGRNPTISDLLSLIMSENYKEVDKTSNSNFECVRSVLVADSVKYDWIVSGLSITFDEATKVGLLIGSNDTTFYTPYLPVINLWRWASRSLSSKFSRIAFELCRMMEVGMNFNPLLFEQFCFRRKIILSLIREPLCEYKSIMLADLYKKGKQSEIATKSVLSTLVDASKRLNILNYSNSLRRRFGRENGRRECR